MQRALAILAMAADREEQIIARWHRARGVVQDAPPSRRDGPHLRRARLLARIAHDTDSFARLAQAFSHDAPVQAWAALGERVGVALDSAAASLEGGAPATFDGLRDYLHAEDADAPDLQVRRFALATVRLVIQDLSALAAPLSHHPLR